MKDAMVLVAMLCAGCSNSTTERASAISTFAKLCAKPLSGTLALDSFGNKLALKCDEFKQDTEVRP